MNAFEMRLLCVLLVFARPSLAAFPSSPCPDVFAYESSEPETSNKWYGGISLRTDDSLVGVRLDIELDRPPDLMVSWLGETTSANNVKYTILNLEQRLRPGPAVSTRIMVKFNRTTGSPKVRSIRLNGRKICSEDTTNNNSVYESPSGSQRPDGIGRPDPEFGEVYNNGNGDEYPTNSNNNYQSTGGSVGGWQSNSGGDNAIRPKPGIATTAAEDLVQPPSVGKPNKATNRGSHETGSDGGGNDRPSNPNMLSLQASSTDSTRNDKQQISGVIDQILSNASTNKTVIIAVINNNNENYQEPSQDRPTGNDRVAATDNASGQSKPVSKNNSNKSPDQQSGSNSKPNQKRGNDLSSSSSQLSNSGVGVCGDFVPAVPSVTGQPSNRGQWPWHVALYLTEGINLSFHCGGSLVSKNKVITAAHCVTNKQNDAVINSSSVLAYLGKYHQLQFSDELGVQTKQVARIIINPSYNSSNNFGDIAVLTLSSDVEFTNYVSPVCLWDERSNWDEVMRKEGFVVGWGYNENDTPTEDLKIAKMPIASQQMCARSYPQLTSDKTFCAGFKNGTSVCNGDGGDGMVVNENSRWYLKGVLSMTMAKKGPRACGSAHYAVFTDASKYLDFVKKNLR